MIPATYSVLKKTDDGMPLGVLLEIRGEKFFKAFTQSEIVNNQKIKVAMEEIKEAIETRMLLSLEFLDTVESIEFSEPTEIMVYKESENKEVMEDVYLFAVSLFDPFQLRDYTRHNYLFDALFVVSAHDYTQVTLDAMRSICDGAFVESISRLISKKMTFTLPGEEPIFMVRMGGPVKQQMISKFLYRDIAKCIEKSLSSHNEIFSSLVVFSPSDYESYLIRSERGSVFSIYFDRGNIEDVSS